jgi:hypothetical protein
MKRSAAAWLVGLQGAKSPGKITMENGKIAKSYVEVPGDYAVVKRLAIAVVILGIVDAVLTFLLVRAGLAIEGNMLLGKLAKTPWLLVIKAAPLGVVILFLRRLAADLRHIKAAKWSFIGLTIFYGLVVAWNGLLAGLLWS